MIANKYFESLRAICVVTALRPGSTAAAETVARSYPRIRDHNDPAIFIALRIPRAFLAQATSETRALRVLKP